MRGWKLVVGVAVAAVALAGCYGPGTYQVTPTVQGGTIGVGLWHTFGGDGCYWARLRGFSGSVGDIIANDFSSGGPRYVETKGTDAGFLTEGCLPWVQSGGQFDHLIGPDAVTGRWNDGDYRVGPEILPGTYQAAAAPGCYWARLSGFSGELSDIIANNIGTGGIVQVMPGDVGFTTTGCGGWTKIG